MESANGHNHAWNIGDTKKKKRRKKPALLIILSIMGLIHGILPCVVSSTTSVLGCFHLVDNEILNQA